MSETGSLHSLRPCARLAWHSHRALGKSNSLNLKRKIWTYLFARASACVSWCSMHAPRNLPEARNSTGPPETGVPSSESHLTWTVGTAPGPLEEQWRLLTANPTPQSQILTFSTLLFIPPHILVRDLDFINWIYNNHILIFGCLIWKCRMWLWEWWALKLHQNLLL